MVSLLSLSDEDIAACFRTLDITFPSMLQKLQANDLAEGEQRYKTNYGGELLFPACFQFSFALAENTSVVSLSLQAWPYELGFAVAEALRHNSTLESLEMSMSPGESGIARAESLGPALAEMLKKTKSFRSLTLIDHWLSDRSRAAIVDAVKENSSLVFFRMSSDSRDWSETMLCMANVLKHNSILQSFIRESYSDGPAIDARSMAEGLKLNTTLLSFQCVGPLTKDTMFALAEALHYNTTLKTFRLTSWSNDTHPTPSGDEVDLAMADALKCNTVLSAFHYEPGHSIGNDIAIQSMAEALSANKILKDFSVHTDGSITGMAMAEMIHRNSTLHSFGWGCEGINNESLTSIVSAIRQSSALKSVMVDYGKDIDNEVAADCFDVLMSSSALRALNILGELGNDLGLIFAEGLRTNTVLQSFKMTHWNSHLGDDFGVAMATMLMQNSTIQIVKIYNTGFTDMTGRAMAEAVKRNSVVQFMDLDSQRMGDETGLAMIDALQHNVSLKVLVAGKWSEEIQAGVHKLINRNRLLPMQWCTLACVARASQRISFSLREEFFRQQVFSWFLPGGCTWPPCVTAVTSGIAEQDQRLAVRDSVLPMANFENLNLVLEEVEHTEPAACIHEDEAAEVVQAQYADFVDWKLGVAFSAGAEESSGSAFTKDDWAHAEEEELGKAFVASKQSPRPLSLDGVTVFRLKWPAPEILQSQHLSACLNRVHSAGCEVQPEWAQGAILLVPITRDVASEVEWMLERYNIVCCISDKELIQEALRETYTKKSRPSLKPDHEIFDGKRFRYTENVDPMPDSDSGNYEVVRFTSDLSAHDHGECDIVVVNTFLQILPPAARSERSFVTSSAPTNCAAESSCCRNPRRAHPSVFFEEF